MTPLFELAPMGILAHLIGDYLLQSDWMAANKTTNWRAALAHVLTYTIPFALLCTHNPVALLLIVGSHFVIDHWRLARYVCWAKNFLAPKYIAQRPASLTSEELHDVLRGANLTPAPKVMLRYLPWSECTATGYDPEKPAWLTVWLLIIADNTLHVICNALALTWLP